MYSHKGIKMNEQNLYRPPAAREIIRVWCDGSCTSSGGVNFFGGYGIVIRYGDQRIELGGSVDPDEIGEIQSTRVEIYAATKAIEYIEALTGGERRFIAVNSDSSQLVDAMRDPSKIRPESPVDLYARLLAVSSRHFVEWRWVRGHSGVEENERADQLATEGSHSAYLRWRESINMPVRANKRRQAAAVG